jgi:DNA-binding transcriptional MerR regulator
MFRIGEFAGLSGVSARTLRAWDALGLFAPAWVDPATGYRAYSPAQLPELHRIAALRDLGVPLAELVALVSGGAGLQPILERRRRALEQDRREAERRLRSLDITVAMAGDGDGDAGLDVVVRRLEAESVAVLRVASVDEDLGPAFYELEAIVRDLGRRAPRPPGAIVEPPDTDGRRAVEVFVPVSGRPRDPASDGRIDWRVLPRVRAATIIQRGGYGGLTHASDALGNWLQATGRPTTGRMRIVYLQFGAEAELRVPADYVVRRDADFVTELQLELA